MPQFTDASATPVAGPDGDADNPQVSRRGRPIGSVAIVHDHLNQCGGAERVVLEMARIWPEASLYTSLYRSTSVFPEFRRLDPQTSFLDRLSVDRGFRALAPAMPLAFRSFAGLDHDVVISSSSGWAHGVRTSEHTTRVVYCYTLAHWLYSRRQYFEGTFRRLSAVPMTTALRAWDRRAARRADAYICIAENVRRRTWDAYGIAAEVVHPPVDTERYWPEPPRVTRGITHLMGNYVGVKTALGSLG